MKSVTVYDIVTERIIALLQKGVVPWQKPWLSGIPKNLISRREYRGFNTVLLNAMNYSSPYWLTFNQANMLGGSIKAGERSVPVVFWKYLEVRNPADPKQKKTVPFIRYHSLFNVDQCEGIAPAKIPAVTGIKREHSPIVAAERILSSMPQRPEIRLGSYWACYMPSFDRVEMPHPENFRSEEDWYATIFHELIHSTGHEKRLNRKGFAGSEGKWAAFGSQPYVREELIAEIGSAFVCNEVGISERTVENSASYIASWLKRLKDDCKLVVSAAAQAQKAADFVLGRFKDASEPSE